MMHLGRPEPELAYVQIAAFLIASVATLAVWFGSRNVP